MHAKYALPERSQGILSKLHARVLVFKIGQCAFSDHVSTVVWQLQEHEAISAHLLVLAAWDPNARRLGMDRL